MKNKDKEVCFPHSQWWYKYWGENAQSLPIGHYSLPSQAAWVGIFH